MADNDETREPENTTDHSSDAEPAGGGTDEGRRRFTKAGGAVITTLLSRPALGVECTPSLLRSWNVSAHPDLIECKYACSPGYWRNDDSGIDHSSCEWDNYVAGQYGRAQFFKAVFNPADVKASDGTVLDPFPGAILEQVVNKNATAVPDDSLLRTAGMHAVAALLNASHSVVSLAYEYTPNAVIDDFLMYYTSFYEAEVVSGTNGNSFLDSFIAKYDVYDDPNRACPLPQGVCGPGNDA